MRTPLACSLQVDVKVSVIDPTTGKGNDIKKAASRRFFIR